MRTQQMLAAHLHVGGSVNPALVQAIEACLDCAQTCLSCADDCLDEVAVAEMKQCIRLDLDCADLCAVAARLALRRTGHNPGTLRAVLEACADLCRRCAAQCDRHAAHQVHCRLCADACRGCKEACRSAAGSLA